MSADNDGDRALLAIRIITGLLTVVMAVTILLGFAAGDFGDEGGIIIDLAWGKVTLIDLYVGLGLFGGWIALRERSCRTLPWLAALAVLGNLAAAAYAFFAALRATSVRDFLLGRGTRS